MFRCKISDDLELRIFEQCHADALFALSDRSRDYLRVWLPWVDATHSVEDTRRFIREALARFACNEGFSAGIWYRGQLSGGIGVHKIDWLNRNTSLGYWIREGLQGKGIVTAACRAVLNHLFGELNLNRVEIRCGTGNSKSRAIPQRLGFVEEGTLRQAQWVNDRFVDLVVYAMLAKDWP